ncbi:hypothetical protein BBP40_000612 [Aspergillus hancockii]|nr:hypothetical protein BBP40_000612 [Aspergillus hancockii]
MTVGQDQDEYELRARCILKEVPLIDGHNDFPFMIRGWHQSKLYDDGFDPYHMPLFHTDFNRLRLGQVGGQFWSAYVPCPPANKSNDFSLVVHHDALHQTLQQIDLIHSLIELYPSQLGLAQSPADVWETYRSGRVASMIGVEGLHQIGNSASVLRMFHRLGVRYITLTHNSNNLYADAALAPTTAHGGLSPEGRDMIAEMNRIGMIVDLSHTSDAVQQQVLKLSKAPVIFSHSSCTAISNHRRNASDAVLDLLKLNHGVIMISFLPELTDDSNPRANATLARVADHVIHVGERIGYEHVGIGSDFDGTMHIAKGLDDVTRYPSLIAELLRRGLSDKTVSDIAGLNVLRVWEQVEAVSREMKVVEKARIFGDEIEPIWDQETIDEVLRHRMPGKTA